MLHVKLDHKIQIFLLEVFLFLVKPQEQQIAGDGLALSAVREIRFNILHVISAFGMDSPNQEYDLGIDLKNNDLAKHGNPRR